LTKLPSEKWPKEEGRSKPLTARYSLLAGPFFAFFSAIAQGGQNAGLNGQKVGFGPFGPSQHQQEVVDVPEWPVRIHGLGDARGDSRGNLIALR
jgi:hypothetical protein